MDYLRRVMRAYQETFCLSLLEAAGCQATGLRFNQKRVAVRVPDEAELVLGQVSFRVGWL